MIRTLVVDNHPAVRYGLLAALRGEPGLVPVAAAAGMREALTEARRNDLDVALVDYHLWDGDGLQLCHRLKALASAPRVLIYTAFDAPDLEVAAAVAGADGILDKGAPLEELFEAVRSVARGGSVYSALRPSAIEQVVPRVETEDLPIFGMRLDGAPLSEIAEILNVDEAAVSGRLLAMLARLAR
ncbi:MAG: response regulator transcription factor [Actinomycetota bacterium]|nr:response regulator transcription factor [Actinomycetota bacterium]